MTIVLIVNGKQVVCTYFSNEQKKVSKILEINTEDEMSAVYMYDVQVMCFFKNSAFYTYMYMYKKVTWYLGINKILREEKQNSWFHLLIIVIYKC